MTYVYFVHYYIFEQDSTNFLGIGSIVLNIDKEHNDYDTLLDSIITRIYVMGKLSSLDYHIVPVNVALLDKVEETKDGQ
jgi:hypothetical protein